MKKKLETIVLGGGCFWCLEAVYLRLVGVENIESGYAGGTPSNKEVNPTYESVSTGKTGHAEVVKIKFDPDKISIEDILKIFFTIHDPTTLNRQGSDLGSQYRSIILYTNQEQRRKAELVRNEIAVFYDKSIVTELFPLDKFYKAEDYHQRYFEKNPNHSYCKIMINPKLSKVKEKYKNLYKKNES